MSGRRVQTITVTRASVVGALLIALVLPILISGCAPSSPLEAVKRMLQARDDDNWDEFQSSILPDDIHTMTSKDIAYRKEWLKNMSQSILFNVKQLQFTEKNTGADTAEVQITGGIITLKDPYYKEVKLDTGKMQFSYTDPEKNQPVTENISDQDAQAIIGEFLLYKTKKYKGGWYVDINLAQPQQPTM